MPTDPDGWKAELSSAQFEDGTRTSSRRLPAALRSTPNELLTLHRLRGYVNVDETVTGTPRHGCALPSR